MPSEKADAEHMTDRANTIREQDEDRVRVLHAVYDLAGGRPGRQHITHAEVYAKAEIAADRGRNALNFLGQSKLVMLGANHTVYLLKLGADHVERSHRQKPTTVQPPTEGGGPPASAEVSALIAFRDLLEELEGLGDDSWNSAERSVRESELRNVIGVRQERVRELVAAVLPVEPLVDRRNGDAELDPFDAIFRARWLLPEVRTLINRAVGKYASGAPGPRPKERPNLPSFTFVPDVALRAILERNAKELGDAFEVEAWTAVIVLAGAIAEGVLFSLLSQRRDDALAARTAHNTRRPERQIQGTNIERWTLAAYIDVANELKCIDGTTEGMAHGVLRDFRNMVHPGVQLRERLTPSETAARGSVLYLCALMVDVAGS